MLIDTHCHIHEVDYPFAADEVIERAHQADVMKMICVGTSESDSRLALEFASKHDGVFASVGVHPHYAKGGIGNLVDLIDKSNKKLVAIGEIGLDYHYDNSPREDQIKVLKLQIEIALKYDLPIIFHVREAYDDFWPIIDEYLNSGQKIRGVLHSFTDTPQNAEEGLKRGLYIGINGFSTFTKDTAQQMMFWMLPKDKILFETDAPFLTPVPFRGKVNEPAFVKNIAECYSVNCKMSVDKIANITTANASTLFKL